MTIMVELDKLNRYNDNTYEPAIYEIVYEILDPDYGVCTHKLYLTTSERLRPKDIDTIILQSDATLIYDPQKVVFKDGKKEFEPCKGEDLFLGVKSMTKLACQSSSVFQHFVCHTQSRTVAL